jgi:uncharacterized cofD-like protein
MWYRLVLPLSSSSSIDSSLAVFSGGSGFNSIAPFLAHRVPVSHILPVSDNGGSSEEIRRALGGIAVGDIRSRLVRLAAEDCDEAKAVNRFMMYRLPVDPRDAKLEWYEIIEGRHELWKEISGPYKDTIRAFLVQFHYSVIKQAPNFDFGNGSLGNFFFVGAYLSMSSIEGAIFLIGSVLRVPQHSAVIPIVNTKTSLTIGAELENGSVIIGQTNISHPNLSGHNHHLVVDKDRDGHTSIGSRICKIFYVNEDLQMTDPAVNPRALQHIEKANHIVYGMGSLFTSIVPNLILKNVGETIAKKTNSKKVLILNGYLDRETEGMTAVDFVNAITNALNRYGERNFPPLAYINHLIILEQSDIHVDKKILNEMGITVHELKGVSLEKLKKNGSPNFIYEPKMLSEFLSTL